MKIVFVPGIRYKGPKKYQNFLNKLKNKGYKVVIADYGYILFPITNKKAKQAILNVIDNDDIVIAYSNGAWACWELFEEEQQATPSCLFLISPALKRNRQFKNIKNKVVCFYSKGDNILQYVPILNNTLTFLQVVEDYGFGRMGKDGAYSKAINNVALSKRVGHAWFKYINTIKQISNKIHRTLEG